LNYVHVMLLICKEDIQMVTILFRHTATRLYN